MNLPFIPFNLICFSVIQIRDITALKQAIGGLPEHIQLFDFSEEIGRMPGNENI